MASEDNKNYPELCRALTDCLRACGPEWTQESFFVCARYTNDYSYYHGLKETLFKENYPREDLHRELSGRSPDERMLFSFELGRSVQALDWISNIIKVEHYFPETYHNLNKLSESFSSKEIYRIFDQDYETFRRLGKNTLPFLFDALESIQFYDSILANTAEYQELKFRAEPATHDALKTQLDKDVLFRSGYRCEKILFPTRKYLNFLHLPTSSEGKVGEKWAICIWTRRPREDELNEIFLQHIKGANYDENGLEITDEMKEIANRSEDILQKWNKNAKTVRSRLEGCDESDVGQLLEEFEELVNSFDNSIDPFAREKSLNRLIDFREKIDSNQALVEEIDPQTIGAPLNNE